MKILPNNLVLDKLIKHITTTQEAQFNKLTTALKMLSVIFKEKINELKTEHILDCLV